MRTLFIRAVLFTLCGLFFTSIHAQKIIVLNLDEPVYSATADYIKAGIKKANTENANCIILKINTPGGLLKPTREIVGAIMESSVPVISFVSPSGAHAGSAGAFIALSADIVAMTPGTNIGAAHPVTSSGKTPETALDEKITNDAAAFIRSIAEKRGRNAVLLKEMVTNSRSFSAKEALEDHTIDFLADNLPDLFQQLNAKEVALSSKRTVTLQTISPEVETVKMGSRERILNFLNNPDVMYLLLLIGLLGVLFEVFNPGALVPGIFGTFCLVLAAYGMSLLPVDYTGLALILLAMVLFLLELKVASFGLLTISGVVSLFFGALFLVKTGPSFDVISVSWLVIIGSIIVTALFFIFIVGLGLKAQLQRKRTGRGSMKGLKGMALEDIDPTGRVRVNGEIWKAKSQHDPIKANSPVEVIDVKNLSLIVKSVPFNL